MQCTTLPQSSTPALGPADDGKSLQLTPYLCASVARLSEPGSTGYRRVDAPHLRVVQTTFLLEHLEAPGVDTADSS